MEIPTDIHDHIIRYLDGTAVPEEKDTLLHWLKESEANRTEFMQIRDLWLSAGHTSNESDPEVDAALQRLHSRIEGEQAVHARPTRRPLLNWYQVAAVLLVLLGISGFWLFTRQEPAQQIIVYNQLITAKGSKGRFILPDSSVVWLNSESRLTYPEHFRGSERIVTLEGEGYFEVTENKAQPFIVKAGEIEVEVLGTAFDVSAYPYKNTFETVLLSGSVKIEGDLFTNDIILTPNQLFSYDKAGRKASVSATKAHLHIDWIKDRLVFDNASLADVIISMEGWYNLPITCPQAFAEKTRMSFTIRGESIDEILSAMSFIIPIRYEIAAGEVKIRPK